MTKLQPRSGAEVTSASNDNHPAPINGEAAAAKIFKEWRSNTNKAAGLNDAAYRYGQLTGAGILSYSRSHRLLREQMKLLGYPDIEYAGAWEKLEGARHTKPEAEAAAAF